MPLKVRDRVQTFDSLEPADAKPAAVTTPRQTRVGTLSRLDAILPQPNARPGLSACGAAAAERPGLPRAASLGGDGRETGRGREVYARGGDAERPLLHQSQAWLQPGGVAGRTPCFETSQTELARFLLDDARMVRVLLVDMHELPAADVVAHEERQHVRARLETDGEALEPAEVGDAHDDEGDCGGGGGGYGGNGYSDSSEQDSDGYWSDEDFWRRYANARPAAATPPELPAEMA